MDCVFEVLGIIYINIIIVKCSRIECTNRYEFQEDIMEALPYLRNCSVVRHMYPICDQKVHVIYSHHPPYVISTKNISDPIGLLPGILRQVMDICCYGCADIIYHDTIDSLRNFRNIKTTLLMPLESSPSNKLFFTRHDYIPFMTVRGVSFFAREISDKTTEYTRELMHTILNTWPLGVTLILMSMISGCVMWVLDMWINEGEFPRSFIRGSFEGFWWAFVSMTSVGYGDRTPKSCIARIFAIIWMLLGITVFSMYTAILASALNSRTNMFESKDFVNKSVGVLNFTTSGKAVVQKERANDVKFANIDEMGSALRNQTIQALALDDNIAEYYMPHLESIITNLKRHHRVKVVANTYGVLSNNSNITNFLQSFFETNEDQRHAFVSHLMYKYSPTVEDFAENTVHSTVFFSSDSPVFYTTIAALFSFGAATIMIGLFSNYIFKKNGELLLKYIRSMKEKLLKSKKFVPLQLNNMEETIINKYFNELEEFKCRWRKKLCLINDVCNKSNFVIFEENNVKNRRWDITRF